MAQPLLALEFPMAPDPAALEEAPATLVRSTLARVAELYPEELRAGQRLDVARHTFHLEQVFRPGGRIADLGGGIGLFAPGAAALGMESWLVDDLRDPVNRRFPIEELGIHRNLGVRVLESPVQKWGHAFADGSLDVISCFESLEHWHHSPRPVFAEAFRVLAPGGLLFLSAPNAVNLKKRIEVPLGRSNWSAFDDWYYNEEFRGHVREPVLRDLLHMVDDLGFESPQVFGRNWMVYGPGRLRSAVAPAVDRLLRPFPTLCSDLYVLARKPA